MDPGLEEPLLNISDSMDKTWWILCIFGRRIQKFWWKKLIFTAGPGKCDFPEVTFFKLKMVNSYVFHHSKTFLINKLF